MKINWDKKVTLTVKELFDLINYGLQVKPSNRVKSKSSFNTGAFATFKKIMSGKKCLKIIEEAST